jgi:hypothetical protein
MGYTHRLYGNEAPKQNLPGALVFLVTYSSLEEVDAARCAQPQKTDGCAVELKRDVSRRFFNAGYPSNSEEDFCWWC